MPTYKLEYFPLRFLAEPARLMFHYVGQEFDDVKITEDEWPERKKSALFGTLPVLTVDEVEIGQSTAIWHYLAKKFDLAGISDLETAQINAIGDFQKDLMMANVDYTHAILFKEDEDKIEQLRMNVFIPNLKKYWSVLLDILMNSKSDFFANSGLTWVDFLIADYFESASKLAPECAIRYPKLHDHSKRIHNILALQNYLLNRPQTVW